MRNGMTMGRIAGALYVTVVVTGIFSLAYVPSHVPTSGAIGSAIANVAASESLYRLGIASLLVNQVAFLLLPLALFQILKETNRSAAAAMVAFACTGIPIALVALSHRLDILSLATSVSHGAPADAALQAAGASALASYRSTLLIANLFWGLWLLPLGYLVVKSRCIPRLLGVFLVLGSVGYCITVFGTVLVPGYRDSAFSGYATLPAAIGEIGTALWLLVFGAKPGRVGAVSHRG